jgi:hypothetical protein
MDDFIAIFASGIVVGLTLTASLFVLNDIDDSKTVKRAEVVKEVELVLDQPQTMRFETVIITSKIGEVEE